MNLELPKKFASITTLARQVAENTFRPISRKYDSAEHAYPVELDMFDAVLRGMEESGAGFGASGATKDKRSTDSTEVRNGKNMQLVLNTLEMCRGDAGLLLTIPGQGLGNAAIAAVANEEQKSRFGGKWAAMAITEPEAGSDSSSIRTTARLDGDEWIINGEKIFVTCGERAKVVVVWATLDRSLGKAAIKSFVVEHGTPGMRVERLEKKLGIRASDTATLVFTDCRIPRSNLLGTEAIETEQSFVGAMKTFDNTRPLIAAMALGVARAALDLTTELFEKERIILDYEKSALDESALKAELYNLEAEYEAARLLTLKAAWMADNGQANSLEASMAKAKAGRVGNEITLKCVELCGSMGYSENLLLEKWSRDSKIFDIFEGTQQIQKLVIARRLLGKTSRDLK
ncbi:MAG: Acyl-CoA dehydrogenase, short-chain specific [Turneriella sp.]|nr:Acyl-CoA dehydrogenase, short-chain specific [Turneriella sp.]